MKALGEAALELPWLSPGVASLTTLAGANLPAVWLRLRTDPGLVLLLARSLRHAPLSSATLPTSDLPLLEEALRHLQSPGCFVDWNQPGAEQVYRTCLRQAQIAHAIAERIGADPERAWMAGLLAPLGWLATCALEQQRAADALNPVALGRRLARHWRLPAWLTACIGQLGLDWSVVERLGVEPLPFQAVQLAILLYQQREPGLALVVGSSCSDLLGALGIEASDAEELVDHILASDVPVQSWESPACQPLLSDLLRLAVENRRLADGGLVEDLQSDLDRLQETLERQYADEQARLQMLKLASLAEFAAGAGHEINNPLAVICGQAQYILKQFQLLDGPADEIDDFAAYLGNLKETIHPSLQKIIGQTQRIHGILTGIMQFARPAPPRPQPIQLGALVRDVAESLQELAHERHVRLDYAEADDGPTLEGDLGQLRVALTCLLRNAIEAAPPDGWAGIRVEQIGTGGVDIVIEDNGKGPPPSVREHLFDPFFSGRSAGRGRGLGLSTAWRLARQQGGDVRFDGIVRGMTRFVLRLPAPTGANGRHTERHHGITAASA